MSPYVRHMVGSVFRSVGRVSLFSKMSEHLLFLNIINVEKRCPEILRNIQLPFCASNSLFFRVGISFRSRILSTYVRVQKPQSGWHINTEYPVHRNIYIKGTAIYFYNGYQNQDLFQDSLQILNSSLKSSEIGHCRSPEIDTHYPVTVMEFPVSRMGFPVSIMGYPVSRKSVRPFGFQY